MGKNNIEVEEKEPISSKFRKGDKCIEIVLKEDVLMEIRKNLKNDNVNKISDLMNFIIKAYDYDLF